MIYVILSFVVGVFLAIILGIEIGKDVVRRKMRKFFYFHSGIMVNTTDIVEHLIDGNEENIF